ncbi:MAG: transglutaminase-like domain-containing protein, partial [Capsulimonadaceae bacterium]
MDVLQRMRESLVGAAQTGRSAGPAVDPKGRSGKPDRLGTGQQGQADDVRKPVFRMPWMLIAAVCVSYLGLYFYTGGSDLVAPIAAALVVTRFVDIRIPHRSWLPWIIRVIVYQFITSNMPQRDPSQIMTGIGAFGLICAVEIALQSWRERPAGNPAGASAILLSFLVMIVACSVGEVYAGFGVNGSYVVWLTPVYATLLLLSIRSMPEPDLPKREGKENSPSPVSGRLAPSAGAGSVRRAIAVAAAVAAGAACWYPIHLYKDGLSTLGDSFLMGRTHAPEATGLSTSPSLSVMVDGSESPARVLRLVNYNGDPHLRGAAFDMYDNGEWGPTVEQRDTDITVGSDLQGTISGPVAHVTCFDDGLKELVAPLNVAGIAPPGGSASRSTSCGLVLSTDSAAPYRYDLDQAPGDTYQGILCPPMTAKDRSRCLQMSQSVEPGVHALAATIAAEVTAHRGRPARGMTVAEADDLARIAAVEDYLLEHYTYSLSVPRGPGDPVSGFLLRGRSGHCQYFGSAAVILLRLLGVPSRYVTGYYAHEHDSAGITVRQRDAHAWCESWVRGVGWIVVDATPGDGLPDRLYGDAPLGNRITEFFSDILLTVREFFSKFSAVQLSAGLAVAAILFYGGRALIQRRRRRTQGRTALYDVPEVALADLASRFDRCLIAAGAPCPPTLPWEEHLRIVAN